MEPIYERHPAFVAFLQDHLFTNDRFVPGDRLQPHLL